MKQTAVEWLEKILEGQKDNPFNYAEWSIALEHAKEMEREQMIGFYKWMLENDTEVNAERYFQFSNSDMLEFYLKEYKIVNNF